MRTRKLVTEAMVKPVGYDVHSVHTAVIINVNWWLMYVWSAGLPCVCLHLDKFRPMNVEMYAIPSHQFYAYIPNKLSYSYTENPCLFPAIYKITRNPHTQPADSTFRGGLISRIVSISRLFASIGRTIFTSWLELWCINIFSLKKPVKGGKTLGREN